MKDVIFSIIMAGLGVGSEKSGHAAAELLRESAGYTPGTPVLVGLKLTIDPGWHSYWVNPGDGGMPLGVKWELPAGWVAGPVLHPLPKRFMTGELPGFGYEGEVVFPVFLTPDDSAQGPAEVRVKLSWLTCDDSACVPGNAELAADFDQELGEARPDTEILAAAMKRIPQPRDGAELEVEFNAGKIGLNLRLPEGADPEGSEVFPVTPTVVDHGKPIRFSKDGAVWRAETTPHEYAAGPLTELSLVLSGGGIGEPLLVSWKAGD